jgi:Zn-dependent peptidase ImmA (M78 family)
VTPVLSIDHISRTVDRLTKKYQTRDPYELCTALGVRIRIMDLGTNIKAYYFYHSQIRNIVLNSRVTPPVRNILVAHELGHDRLHKKIAMQKGFQELELFNQTLPCEYEANIFAAELMVPDRQLLDLINDEDKSFFDVAHELCVPAPLLDFKLRILKHKGYRYIEALYIANGDFLQNDIDGCFVEEEYY